MTDHLTIDGADLAYEAAGPPSGEPVLMLHGYFGSHMTWRHQIDALSDDYRVVAPDWFGWGASGLTDDAEYDREVDRIGRIADALGWEAFNLFGHDYGGFIGLGFAERYPERLRRLALLNSRAHGSFVPRWYVVFGLVSLTASLPLIRRLIHLAPLQLIHRWATRRERRLGAIDEEAWASHTGNLTPEALIHIFQDYRVGTRRPLGRRLSNIDVPTAVIWGTRDRYLDVDLARQLADTIPKATLELVDGAGHFVPEERPEAVAAHLLELLERSN